MSERGPSDRNAIKIRKAAVALRLSIIIFHLILGILLSLIVHKGVSQPAQPLAPLGHSPALHHPYARSVEKQNSPETFPDVGQIFQDLLKGRGVSIALLKLTRLLTMNISLPHLTLAVSRA